MGQSLTPDQVRNKSVLGMPAPLGEIHHWLHDELAWLHIKWSNFHRLYATSHEQLDLLNAAAPAFFHQLQRMIWEDVLLHLCRLTDPPETMGHANLTISRIPDAIPDPGLRDVVKPLVDDAIQKTRFARDWRNRRLAHQELPASQGQVAAPLAPASGQNVEDALAALRKVMNRVERHYLNESVLYEHSIPVLGGVEALLARLTKGIRAEKAERERKLGG
jgi:hypothetical protein